MKKIFLLALIALTGCAYHNPFDKAGFRNQILNTPPYVLSAFYRINKPGEPLTIYVEKEYMDAEQSTAATEDKSANVAYLSRPCQYLETDICAQKQDPKKQQKAIQKGIKQLQKKADADQVIVKGF